MIYTDMNNGDYLAPIACIKAKLGADALEDLHYTLRSGQLPDKVRPLDVQTVYQIQK